MRVIGVIRVSTEGQAGEKGEGLAQQRTALRQIEAELQRQHPNLHVLPPVELIDVSGSDLADTPEWHHRILPAIQQGTHLMAATIDRLIRADRFDMRVLESLTRAGGRLYVPGRSYDTTDARDRMTLMLFAGVGGFEKSEITRRAQAGKEEKRKRGEWVSRLDATPYATVYDRENKRWSYDPEKAPLVAQAFRDFHAGTSLKQIAQMLGVTPVGARVVLANPIYTGMLVYREKRGEKYVPKRLCSDKAGRQAPRRKVARAPEHVIEVQVYGGQGQEPALVSDDLYAAVQQRLASIRGDGRKRRERTRPTIYLSGLMFSAHETDDSTCLDLNAKPQHVIYGDAGGEHRPVRYACRCKRDRTTDPRAPRPRCSLGYLHAEHVNRAVDSYLTSLTTENWGIEHVREQLHRWEAQGNQSHLRAELERQIKTLDQQEDKLTDLLLEGRIDKARHHKKQDALRKKRDDLKHELAALKKPLRVDLDAVQRAWVYDANWSPDEKRAWVMRWCRGLFVRNEGIDSVTLRLPSKDGSTVLFVGGEPRSWHDLTGADIYRTEGRLAAQGLFTASEVIRRLGWEPGTASTNRLSYLVRSGKVPAPTGHYGIKRVWTEDELQALLDAVAKL